MAGFCGSGFSNVLPFAFVADSCLVAGDTGPELADPRMRPVPPMDGVCFAFSAGVGFESLRLFRQWLAFVCRAFGSSSPPVAGRSGDEDDAERETLCTIPPRRLLMAGSQGGLRRRPEQRRGVLWL